MPREPLGVDPGFLYEFLGEFLDWANSKYGYSLREEQEDYGEMGRVLVWSEVYLTRELLDEFIADEGRA